MSCRNEWIIRLDCWINVGILKHRSDRLHSLQVWKDNLLISVGWTEVCAVIVSHLLLAWTGNCWPIHFLPGSKQTRRCWPSSNPQTAQSTTSRTGSSATAFSYSHRCFARSIRVSLMCTCSTTTMCSIGLGSISGPLWHYTQYGRW